MFSTEYAPRPQRGPSRPSTPNNRPQTLKAEPSLRHSSSSGWGWPRRVEVEVDIEDKGHKESPETPRMNKPEQPGNQESARGNLPSGSSGHTIASPGDKQPVQTRSAESGEQGRASAIDQEPGEDQIRQVQKHQDPSQTQPSDLGSSSPAPSDDPHRSREAFNTGKFPESGPTRSPAVSVRRVGSGSSNSEKKTQQLEADTGNQTAELTEDASANPDHQALRSDQTQSNETVEKDLQPPKAKDLTPDARTELSSKDNITTKIPETERRESDSESKGSKRLSVSAGGGKPPGSFPGADSSSEEQPTLSEEAFIHEPASVPEVSNGQGAAGPKIAETEHGKDHGSNEAVSPNKPVDRPHVWSGVLPQDKALTDHKAEGKPELGGAENESNKPHVTFKEDEPDRPVSEPRVSTDHIPQESTTKEYGKEIIGQPLAKPQGSIAYRPDRAPNATDSKKAEQIRRPSRDSLRTRSRKPSVYIPLSKVAEAKGKIESAITQPPRSGEIINAEVTPSPTDEPKEIARDSHAILPDDTQKGAHLDEGEMFPDSPANRRELGPIPGLSQTESSPIPGPSQTKSTEMAPLSAVPSHKQSFDDEQSTATPSPPSDVSLEGTGSRRSSVVRKELTPEDVVQRISLSGEQTLQNSPTQSHKSKRRSVKMSLPPKIVVQSPSSASELPEPLPTPAVPISADEYKIKTRSGTIVSVEHTVQGAAEQLSQTPPRKRKLFLRKVRNFAARKIIPNATLGRQMGGRTKGRLRQLAKGEELPSSPIPAQENAPDLPPLRKRKSFIRKARNFAARQAFLNATLGRQVAAETKPVLRRMANGEMVVVEEGHSFDVKR